MRLAALKVNLARVLASQSVPTLSIGNNTFTLQADGNTKVISKIDDDGLIYCRIIFVDANPNLSKMYYREKYAGADADGVPPTCYSDDGVLPAANAQEQQAPSCAECQWNIWGSAISQMTGTKIKACRDVLKTAVVVPEFGPEPFLLRIPPASLRNFQAYISTFSNIDPTMFGREANAGDFATYVYFEQGKQGIINFMAAPLEAGEHGLAEQIQESNSAATLIGLQNIRVDNALPAPAHAGAKQIAAPKHEQMVNQATEREAYAAAGQPEQEIIPPKKSSKFVDEDDEDGQEEVQPAPKKTTLINKLGGGAQQAAKPNVTPAAAAPKGAPSMAGMRTKTTMGGGIATSPGPAKKPAAGPQPKVAGIPQTNMPGGLKGMLAGIMGMDTTT